MRNHECPRVSSAPVWHPSDSTSTPARHYARAPCHPRVPALATLKQRSKATVRAGPVRSTRTPMRGPSPQSCRRPGPDDQNAPPDISRYALNVEPVGSGVALFRGPGRPGEVAQRRDVQTQKLGHVLITSRIHKKRDGIQVHMLCFYHNFDKMVQMLRTHKEKFLHCWCTT